MTQRLTDDEIAKLWQRVATLRQLGCPRTTMRIALEQVEGLLDEIEERRRIDAASFLGCRNVDDWANDERRLADAEQAFREECEAEEQKRKDFIAKRNDPELDAVEERASKFWNLDLRGRMKRVDGYLPSVPAGKDGGA
jgi:hypothetical protein